MTADRPAVERHLRHLREMATVLRRHQGLKPEDLSGNLETCLMIQHAFQLAIQGVIDIGNHLLAARGGAYRTRTRRSCSSSGGRASCPGASPDASA